MRRILYYFVPACIIFSVWSNNKLSSYSSGNGPVNLDTSSSCWSCHKATTYGINDSASIQITGLPLNNNIQPGATYTFSVTVNNLSVPARKRYGFSLRAMNSSGVNVGTFTASGNTQVGTFGSLKHGPTAVPDTPVNSFTFGNLQWTAPLSPTGATITFKATALVGNNNGSVTRDFVADFISSAVLPVELSDFTAQNIDGAIHLAWTTASEEKFKQFELERSMDGVHFERIAIQEALGKNNQGYSYNYVDQPEVSGEYFYRLKLVDNDLSSKNSKIVSALYNNGVSLSASVYPNPIYAGKQATLQVFNAINKELNLVIYNANGAAVYTKSYIVNKGTNNILLPNNLSSGNYIIRLNQANKEQFSLKINVL